MTDEGVVPPPSGVTPPPVGIQPAPSQHNMFFGPNGMRAGWRALLFLIFTGVILILLAVILRLLAGMTGAPPLDRSPSTLTPLRTAIGDAIILLAALLAAFLMSRIERRSFNAYGLPIRFAFGRHFWIGALAGFAAISASLLGIFALHGFRVTTIAIHGRTMLGGIAAWSVAFVFVGLSEEFSFRGYLQYTLSTGMGFWPAAVLLSLLFGAAHSVNPGENIFGLASVVLFALLFCLFLRRTGNLWWAVGFHAGWDWGQTFFYGVPDSGMSPYHSLFSSALNGPRWLTGGTVGPEASIFTPIALLLVAVLFSRAYPQSADSAERLASGAIRSSVTS